MRNYSDKTLEAYRYRIGKFEAFVRSKPPDHLDTGRCQRISDKMWPCARTFQQGSPTKTLYCGA